jgi:uncharacterized alkaline shock family protein YloU
VIPEDENTDLGTIKIHNNVIASIAYLATLEVDGIARICDDLRSRIYHALGKKTKSGAIDVRSEKNEAVAIIIPIIVKYGYNIPEVALKVQERVKSMVEESTDLSPKEIIVKIKGVEK